MLAIMTVSSGVVFAQDTAKLIIARTPAYEIYGKKLKENSFGVNVTVEEMLFDRLLETSSIAFSSQAPGIDIIQLNDPGIRRYAQNGWLEPLDDLWEKYKEQYKLDDFPQSVIDGVSYDGHIYAIPFHINSMVFYYRKDLFDKAGLALPKSMEEYLQFPEKLADAGVPPLNGGMGSLDWTVTRTHWFLNSIGDGWFDDKWRPAFNSENGVKAIQAMKDLAAYAPRGWTSQEVAEEATNLSMGITSGGTLWPTRALSMEDKEKSQVVGKMAWATVPGGGARIAYDGLAIPKSSALDRELAFKLIAETLSSQTMKENANRVFPPRTSVAQDPELRKLYPWYEATDASVAVNKRTPAIAEFAEVSHIVAQRVLQAVTGEMEVKEAMDAAAKEATALLESKGYYKQ
ncbi:extracellular solute-binding protein [Corticibacterium sp. UT-5YL-CI-8]|nr:extracellular solute-binding protein [Tianweitania sp. UT-5YL-CI-8]